MRIAEESTTKGRKRKKNQLEKLFEENIIYLRFDASANVLRYDSQRYAVPSSSIRRHAHHRCQIACPSPRQPKTKSNETTMATISNHDVIVALFRIRDYSYANYQRTDYSHLRDQSVKFAIYTSHLHRREYWLFDKKNYL